MHKIKKLYLIPIILFVNIAFNNVAYASGFGFDGISLYMFRISEMVFFIGFFIAALLAIAGFFGAITGKFKIKIYIPFIFLLISIISLVVPNFFPQSF